ncbi:unnamed protein product [Closterium sp. Naga37s-1]|nr:unnamed protein product [Closterium sp. Naga37s-1]
MSTRFRVYEVGSPQASAADMAAIRAIFTAALLPIPANKPNACAWPGVSCAVNGAVFSPNFPPTALLLPLSALPFFTFRSPPLPRLTGSIPTYYKAHQALTFLSSNSAFSPLSLTTLSSRLLPGPSRPRLQRPLRPAHPSFAPFSPPPPAPLPSCPALL